MGNIDYKITGSASDAEREVDKLRAQFEKLEDKIRNTARHSKRGSDESNQGLRGQIATVGKLALSYVSVQSGIRLATKLLTTMAEEQRRLNDLRNEVVETLPEAELKLRNQGRLDEEQFRRVEESVNREAIEIPVSPVLQAVRTSEELLSQGFKTSDVESGAALEAFRELQVVSNQFGRDAQDPKELVKSLATALRNAEGGTGNLGPEGIREFTRDFVSLFEASPIQLADAIPFARIKAILSERGQDDTSQLAAFTALLEKSGSGDVAATQLQQATGFLARASSSAITSRLEKQGLDLDPTEFDLIGEDADIVVALRNLNRQLDALSESDQVEARNILFGGTKGQVGISNLAASVDRIEEARKTISEADADELVGTRLRNFDQSTFARSRRAEIDREIKGRQVAGDEADLTIGEVGDILDARLAERTRKARQKGGLGGFAQRSFQTFEGAVQRGSIDFGSENLGFSPLESVGLGAAASQIVNPFGFFSDDSGGRQQPQEVESRQLQGALDQMSGSLDKAAEAMKESSQQRSVESRQATVKAPAGQSG